MSDRQLKLYATDTGNKTITTTINNVNPEVDSATMVSFTKKLNAFTRNSYTKSDMIETTNLDTESIKKASLLKFNSMTGTVVGDHIRLDVEHGAGATFGVAMTSVSGSWASYTITFEPGQGVIIENTNTPGTYSVYVGTTETSAYYSNAISGSVTVTAS